MVGRARSAIEGYGYSVDSYYEALKELETRFGNPSLVVKVTLDRLRKTSRIQNDRPHEVRNLSDVVSTTVWIFKRFGYINDLAAEANISIAVDKLSPDLQVKWKDHVRTSNLHQPNLEDFCSWLKGQADIYDDCFKFPFRGRYGGAGEKHNTFFGNLSSRNKQAKPCLMGDGQQHNLSACPKFKALSVEERLSEVQKHKLCFCCLRSGHWLTTCRNLKPCGVNGCTRSHNALLHSSRNVTPDGNNETAASTNQAATEAVTPSTEHSSAPHKSSSDSVLLQVVPVTLYGPKGYFNTYAMLDTGSTCSLLATDVAKNLGLEGPVESVLLNGIQKSSRLLTKRVDVQVSQLNDFGTRFDVHRVLVVDRLNVPERRVNFRELQEKWPHLPGLELNEVSPTPVTLHLASDVPELIVTLETRCGRKGSPVGVRTKLGWTVTGRLPGYIEDGESVYKVHMATPDEVLHETVKTWWRTENFGCRYDCDVQRSVEDEKVLKFLSERTQEVEGRYEVPLLWKDENIQLPDNRVVAIHRLGLLEKRLQRDPELGEAYKKNH